MTNPIDPKRLENALEAWNEKGHLTICPANREILIKHILAADDRYRREHPPKLSSEQWKRYGELIEQDRLGDAFLFLRDILLAPAPHDAAKETNMPQNVHRCNICNRMLNHDGTACSGYPDWCPNGSDQPDDSEVSPTGITPAANPTSGGNVEQDAAGEEREPELPPKWRFGDYGHKKAYWYTPEGDDLTYTHADAHVEVNRCDAHELEAIARHMRYRKRLQDKREKEVEVTDAMVDAAMNVPLRSDDTCADVIRRRLEAALNCRDEADGEGK